MVQRRAHRSLGVMVGASLTSAACGVVLTFCIPRLLSVHDFGVWRTFLLYAGYAGLLHFGLIDGALLVWSRMGAGEAAQDRGLLSGAMRFLVVEHLVLLAAAVGSLWLHLAEPLPMVLIALAVYALLFNLVALVQVYLQVELRFTAVAFGMGASPVLFVGALGVLALTHVSLGRMLVAYLAALGAALLVLLWMAYGRSDKAVGEGSAWRAGVGYIAAGWPIVLANIGFGLMQSADRVTVNVVRPLHDFAVYSLSQSTIYVPITILAATSRVAFSWFARALAEDRAELYRSSTRLLALLWMVLLPYFFVVEWIVRRWLPRYVQGLPAGRILLLSVLFLSLIQIVQMNTFSLEGRQREFFAGSIVAVAVAFGTAWVGSQAVGSLAAVAWSQVVTAGLWWLGNEWYLRDRKLLGRSDSIVVLATFGLASGELYLASLGSLPTMVRIGLYCGMSVVPLVLMYRAELRYGWRAVRRR